MIQLTIDDKPIEVRRRPHACWKPAASMASTSPPCAITRRSSLMAAAACVWSKSASPGANLAWCLLCLSLRRRPDGKDEQRKVVRSRRMTAELLLAGSYHTPEMLALAKSWG